MDGAFARDALRYHAAGVNVLPIMPGTKRPPAGVLWKVWQRRRQTEDELARLLEAHGSADVGITLGGPRNLVDIETDGPEGENSLRNLRLPVPATTCWRSPRGIHRIYTAAGPVPSRTRVRPGLDVLATGRYVIAPTSAGREWLVEQLDDAAPLPEALLAEVINGNPDFPLREASNEIYLDTRLPCPQKLGSDGLEEFFRRPDMVLRMAAVLGLPPAIGRGFRCILPGHGERQPSASLFRNASGVLVYRDWHRRSGFECVTLPEVRAALAYGEVRRLKAPELATWALRLLVEAGILEPARVPAVELQASARAAVRSVYRGFLLLLGCKWLYSPEDATPFSWRFAAAWCGISERHVGEAMNALLRAGFIRKVGQYRRMALFLPETCSSPRNKRVLVAEALNRVVQSKVAVQNRRT